MSIINAARRFEQRFDAKAERFIWHHPLLGSISIFVGMRMIEDTKKWVLSPERKAPQATREYAAHRLDTVLDKFLKTMQSTAARLQEKLLKPEVRQKGKEQVKEKARDSVLQLLNRLQAEQAQRKPGEPYLAENSKSHFQ